MTEIRMLPDIPLHPVTPRRDAALIPADAPRCYCGRPRRPRRDGTFPTYCPEHD